MENEVKILKLLTGEELISRMKESDDGFLILEKPMSIQTTAPTPSGHTEMGLLPWSIAGKTDKITLDDKHVMVILEPTKEIETNYLSASSIIPESVLERTRPSFGGGTPKTRPGFGGGHIQSEGH